MRVSQDLSGFIPVLRPESDFNERIALFATGEWWPVTFLSAVSLGWQSEKFERMGSSGFEDAIQARTPSLLCSRTGKKTNEIKTGSDSDAQLAERLKQQDEHAFLQLYDQHQRSVYRFLMHMTASVSAAEELTQEVFVVILDAICAGKMSQFDPERGTLEGYLIGIARNLAREEHRRAGRLVSLESVLETSEWSRNFEKLCRENSVWDAATALALQSELRILYRAILELPEHYRAVVVLCSLQQKSYQEAAALLQCSEGTVASRMNRAKALLTAKLRRPATNELAASLPRAYKSREPSVGELRQERRGPDAAKTVHAK
jgi:RNA polymerase sigma-70 factor, ECF subfamily